MDRRRIRVDFNELVAKDLVLLSKTDSREDSEGRVVPLTEGQPIGIYCEDYDEDGTADYLIPAYSHRRFRAAARIQRLQAELSRASSAQTATFPRLVSPWAVA